MDRDIFPSRSDARARDVIEIKIIVKSRNQ